MSADNRRWPLLSGEELDHLPPPTWLIDGMVTDGLTVLAGDPASGKTFLALDWALCIASGQPWLQTAVTERPVLYVTGEGTAGLPARRRAWIANRGHPQARFYCIPHPVNLLDDDDVEALSADVYAVGAGLLVIDTLARCMAGDENSAQDMGGFVSALDRIRSERSCAALVVHHTGVEKGRPRGSTALHGAVDTMAHLSNDNGDVELKCWKQKDAAPFPRWNLKLRQVGDSCVLAPSLMPPKKREPF